jgi:serine protease inhibitor
VVVKKVIKNAISTAALSLMVLAGPPAFANQGGSDSSMSDDLALKLFTKVARGAKDNVLLSPFSAYQVLSMAANGAAGNTRAQMTKMLGVGPGGLAALNKRNHDVIELLNVNENVRMEVADAIYSDKRAPLKPSFVDLCRKLYFAQASCEDFGSPNTLKIINKWCSEKTHGKITSIVDSLDPGEKLVLLNSVYFKGKWADPFQARDTAPQRFTLLSGAVKPVPMMHAKLGLAYLDEDKFQAVSIPYAGRKQQMYIFLPKEGVDFAKFVTQFTGANWTDWLSRFSPMEVNLEMPKYKVEYSTELNAPLQSLGMTDAFCLAADFSGMFVARSANISRVVQKTYLDVNEEGTEAAAVTGGFAKGLGMVEPEPIHFRVDHPFVVALVDSKTGESLFLGAIVNP